MKSHDCHVLMTQILPVAIRGIMDAHVRETLFGLCNFFDVISRKSVGVRQLRRLQEEIVVILCELEMYFPPAFFDVMVHLLVHIVEDIIQLGPMFLHSMMPFERMNGVIKGYVRNRARPDGSIAKGFLTEECISFCTSYLEIENPVGLPVNRHLGKLAGWGHRDGSREMHVDFKGRIADFERANLVALQHIDVVDPWVVEHKTFIAKTYSDQGQQRTDGDIIKEHNSTFTRWFKDKMLTYPIDEDSSAEEKLIFALSQGAEHNLMTFQAYDINGYTFYTEEKDMKSDYQNSGVTMESYTGDVKQRYYGKIEEIWELSYAGENVPMFRVRWAKNVIKEDRHFTTMVIPEAKSKTAGAKVTAKYEPWVLASQVDQCFFITDPQKPSRVVVRRGKRSIIGMDGAANELDFDQMAGPGGRRGGRGRGPGRPRGRGRGRRGGAARAPRSPSPASSSSSHEERCFEFLLRIDDDPLGIKRLPDKFAEFVDGVEPAHLQLREASCNFCRWSVEVLFDGQGKMYLHTGWDKFARDLHLEPGCQLTFLYEGDGEMIVKVFDDTACRVHYPHTGESGSDTDS
ncbi:hypothetical protein QYE76_026650 [Lolium multiflorum]|uniref:TF-B3 domain-containing protein n=1 Tax=Lolium multiflorum TaxID=4521 RepID=A0AAD8RKT6_LOLMU|nr:hypothetical protein QYE76_026650 [Lolium multiflorum]